jgi:hypothetical protein
MVPKSVLHPRFETPLFHGFVGGLEIQLVGYAENTKRSKKSQALGITILFAW